MKLRVNINDKELRKKISTFSRDLRVFVVKYLREHTVQKIEAYYETKAPTQSGALQRDKKVRVWSDMRMDVRGPINVEGPSGFPYGWWVAGAIPTVTDNPIMGPGPVQYGMPGEKPINFNADPDWWAQVLEYSRKVYLEDVQRAVQKYVRTV